MATHSSTLAWKIPWTEEPGGLQSMGLLSQKKAGVAILILDKMNFNTKVVKRDKEGHYIMIKGSI